MVTLSWCTDCGAVRRIGSCRPRLNAVVEAKAAYRTAGDGLQQAKEYALILGLKFAYATNGHSIIEHDFLTGLDNEIKNFPKPSELWARLTASEKITED